MSFSLEVFLVCQARKVIKVSQVTQAHQDLVAHQVYQDCQVSKQGLSWTALMNKDLHVFLSHGVGMLIHLYLN